MKKLYILLTIIAVLGGIPAAQADTQQTARVLGEQEKTCLAKQDIYRLQVPIIGCTPSDTVCCSDDGIYTIGLKGAPSYIATMVRFGIIVVITIMFLMLIVAGVQFQLSFGNTTSAYKALDRVKRAAMGLVVVLFSTVILYQINPDLIELKLATPEGIALTVCCKIPTGVKQPTNQVTTLVYGATQKTSSTIVSQTQNADHSVTVKWSSGETSIYKYKDPEGTKYCTLQTKDASGKVVFTLSPNFYMVCPSNVNFPTNYTIKTWEVIPQAGTVQDYTLDPNLNTCKVITTVNGIPDIPLDCPDDTPIPDLSPTLTWKEVLAANLAATQAMLLTSNEAQSSSAFTYYMATEFKGKSYVCNGSDQVEEDTDLCFSRTDAPNKPESTAKGVPVTIGAGSRVITELCETAGKRGNGEPIGIRSLNVSEMNSTYGTIIDQALAANPHDPRITKQLVATIIAQESNGVVGILGPQTKYGQAMGLMQVLADVGVKDCKLPNKEALLDPKNNITCGIYVLNSKMKSFGSLRNAIAGYNGSGSVISTTCAAQKNACGETVNRWECLYDSISADGKNGVTNAGLKESRDYVRNVLFFSGVCPSNLEQACK